MNAKLLCLFLLSVCCLPADGWGQTWRPAARSFTRQLERRAALDGAAQAERALNARAARLRALNEVFEGNALSLEEKELAYTYFRALRPEPFLAGGPVSFGSQLARNAWGERNNLHAAAERVVMERHLRALRRGQKELEAALISDARAPLPSIPADAKYIFLGEIHHRPEVRELMLDIIFGYRAAHRNRRIIVLSEFAPDRGVAFMRTPPARHYEEYTSFFGELLAAGIPVAGLEEAAVLADERSFWSDCQSVSVQRTPEGMRLRNLHWAARIREWRAKYPDAVFFIYAGNAHTEYNMPFSISAGFPREETFVFSVHEKDAPARKPFHAVTGNRFALPGALLSWKDPRWGRTAGFDAAFILP